MKRCPSCQRTYPDDAPDFCQNDGVRLVSDPSSQQQYYGSGSGNLPSYGAQSNQPPAPPWSTPGGQPQPPNWQAPAPPGQQNWGGNYPAQNQPYGAAYGQAATGGGGLSTGAMITGIIALVIFVGGFILGVIAVNERSRDMLGGAGIVMLLAAIIGFVAIILGVITLVLANSNRALSKAKGIVGICLGIIPILMVLLGLARSGRL